MLEIAARVRNALGAVLAGPSGATSTLVRTTAPAVVEITSLRAHGCVCHEEVASQRKAIDVNDCTSERETIIAGGERKNKEQRMNSARTVRSHRVVGATQLERTSNIRDVHCVLVCQDERARRSPTLFISRLATLLCTDVVIRPIKRNKTLV